MNGVAMHITEFFHSLGLTPNAEVVVARLPERCAFDLVEFAGSVLLEHLESDSKLFSRWFAQQQVHVLGHNYVTADEEVVPLASAVEDFEEYIT